MTTRTTWSPEKNWAIPPSCKGLRKVIQSHYFNSHLSTGLAAADPLLSKGNDTSRLEFWSSTRCTMSSHAATRDAVTRCGLIRGRRYDHNHQNYVVG